MYSVVERKSMLKLLKSFNAESDRFMKIVTQYSFCYTVLVLRMRKMQMSFQN